MRVIAGSARRLLLKTIPGNDTRPTTDIIKETLFNMLAPDLEGSVFLDLFSGSGAIGIEALSRGAKSAVFIEKNSLAAKCIRENLEHTHLSDRAKLINGDILYGLKKIENKEIFDIVFLDPPYDSGLEAIALKYLSESNIISEDSLIIVELSKEFNTDSLLKDWSIIKEKLYKSNKHIFLKRRIG